MERYLLETTELHFLFKPDQRATAAALAFFDRRVTFSLVISTFLDSSK
jgi:hypothetical protein